MPSTLPTFIYFSKTKLKWLLFISIVFDLGGIVCTTINPGSPWSFTPHFFTRFSFLGVLIFAFGLYWGYAMIKKLGDNEPVITIDDEGIKRREGKVIPWRDVERIEIEESTYSNGDNTYKDRYVVPVLKNRDEYYSEGSKKLAAAIGGENTGAPIKFSTINLNCSTDELQSMMEEKLNAYLAAKSKG